MTIVETERPTNTQCFEAMGSDAEVIVVGGTADLVDAARRRLEDLEQRWSRFRPDSEVSRLNRAPGEPFEVSDETALLIERAREAYRLTGGAFDATVLGDVVRAGYDRTFDQLGLDHPTVDGRTIELAPGAGFDPGGIGKGLAADLVVDELMSTGAAGACVNLGGDLRVSGEPPDGVAWTIDLDHPWAPFPVLRLGIADGAIATSSTLRRRWVVDGVERHHLIDPRSGEPSDTDLTLATVIARRGWVAEVLTKAVLLAGGSHTFDIVGGTGAEALAVDDHGDVRASDGFAAFVERGEIPDSIWSGRHE
jgi:thiamine biosynthesis lipoprotein